jgi:RNA methyltransferase, TrmH family
VIASPQNPRIKSLLRAVEDRSLFAIEGEKLIADAVQNGFAFEEILHDEDLKPGRISALSHNRATVVTREVLKRFSQAATPQHVVALARRKDTAAGDIFARDGPVVFLEGVQDPGNLGAVARTLEAVGGAGLLCSPGCADVFHPRALRGSAGSLLRMPAAGNVDFRLAAEAARKEGRPVFGTVGRGGSSLFDESLPRDGLFAFGSEATGLSDSTLAALDRKITIPMKAPVESLNVAVAVAIVLYRIGADRPAQ